MKRRMIKSFDYTSKMSWTMTGVYEGKKASITWKDGELLGDSELSGSQAIVRRIIAVAKTMEGKELGPVMGPYTYKDHLKSPLTTLWLSPFVFDEDPRPKSFGDVPYAWAPKGAKV